MGVGGDGRKTMNDENKLVPRENGNAVVEVVSQSQRFPSIDLSPREPHLYDYLLILRKHQWLILSFLLAVVMIVSFTISCLQSDYRHHQQVTQDKDNSLL